LGSFPQNWHFLDHFLLPVQFPWYFQKRNFGNYSLWHSII
jgi:hypothetical protein